MIAYLSGEIIYFTDNSVIIDVNGVGYEVNIPLSQMNSIGSIGEHVHVHTHLQVKEDDMSLFGFTDKDDLYLFKKLITVSGVGPRSAMGLISILDANDLISAIAHEDADMLAKAPGIGKKMAQKIILELKDKLVGKNVNLKAYARQNENINTEPKHEALEALMGLGYQQNEIAHLLKQNEVQDMNTEAIIKYALKQLAKF